MCLGCSSTNGHQRAALDLFVATYCSLGDLQLKIAVLYCMTLIFRIVSFLVWEKESFKKLSSSKG